MLTVEFDRLGRLAGAVLLDLGCGQGRHSFEALRRGASVVALDSDATGLAGVSGMFEAMVAAGEVAPAAPGRAPAAPGQVIVGDALGLPFAGDSFDVVIASEVLEHVARDTAAMAELARVLKPSGRAAVTVPRCWTEVVNWALSREYHSVEGGHIRIYRRSQLVARLSSEGLRVVGSHHAHAFHSPYWWLRCVLKGRAERSRLVAAYHRALVWDMTSAPEVVHRVERLLDMVMGKSLVLYLEKRPCPGPEDQA